MIKVTCHPCDEIFNGSSYTCHSSFSSAQLCPENILTLIVWISCKQYKYILGVERPTDNQTENSWVRKL